MKLETGLITQYKLLFESKPNQYNTIFKCPTFAAFNSESDRLDDSGIFYFEGDQNSDVDSGYSQFHDFKIGSELNDYITNHNSGSGVFDWTIEVGFRSANSNHWMANNNNNEGDKFPHNSTPVIEYQGGAIRTSSANTQGSGYSYDEGKCGKTRIKPPKS